MLFRFFLGDDILPSSVGIILNHDIRIPIKQHVYGTIIESTVRVVFFVPHVFGYFLKKNQVASPSRHLPTGHGSVACRGHGGKLVWVVLSHRIHGTGIFTYT